MFSRFQGVVWVSVLAVALGSFGLIAAVAGADTQIVASLGFFGVILASMAPRA